jgi:phenylalanine ammonia-lyase
MEKTRLALQSFGRILFAQLTEMIDPNFSRGLPANLAADDPSLSFTMKGVEISMAAYMAELSYYANPVSSHVQAAEMHNQSINSMALVSARMSMEAIDILTMMCACSLYVCCQGLDLRALHLAFMQKATTLFDQLIKQYFAPNLDWAQLSSLNESLHHHFSSAWEQSAKLDIKERCEKLVDSTLPIILCNGVKSVEDLLAFKSEATEKLFGVWTDTFNMFLERQNTVDLLGEGSKVLYQTIRHDLGVPFHSGLAEHPTWESKTLRGRPKKTIGGWLSIIHGALKTGQLYSPLMASIKEKGVNGHHDPTKHTQPSEQYGSGRNGCEQNGSIENCHDEV